MVGDAAVGSNSGCVLRDGLTWIIHELRRENVKRVPDQRVAAG
jgi:hypothetical protein